MGKINDLYPAPNPDELRALSVALTRAHYAIGDLCTVREDERASRAFDALVSICQEMHYGTDSPELDEAVRVLERLAQRIADRGLNDFRRRMGDPTMPPEPENVVRLIRSGE